MKRNTFNRKSFINFNLSLVAYKQVDLFINKPETHEIKNIIMIAAFCLKKQF